VGNICNKFSPKSMRKEKKVPFLRFEKSIK